MEEPIVMEPIMEYVKSPSGKPDEKWHLTVKIRDAECYSAHTSSTFTVFLATLDSENKFVSAYELDSSQATYDDNTTSYIFEGKIDCVPRADAVFIRFHSQPDDPWAIDQIDVDVFFILDRDNIETPSHLKEGRQTYNWHFEHAVLMPCSSWLKGTHLYQIGPRNGLFIEHEYLAIPSPGQWVRDWV
ncbi:hypothetical protein Aduo_013540 [Ancylostoma duodenale]